LAAFDAPTRQFCLNRRTITNTPQQALTLLNDPLFHTLAEALGLRLQREPALSDQSLIEKAFQLTLSRAPGPEEANRFQAFLQNHPGSTNDKWRDLATVFLNLDESLTRP
ncbi:MAG: DUF1553 domain-containing protein, partial [Verrucomicrobiota bacterium]